MLMQDVVTFETDVNELVQRFWEFGPFTSLWIIEGIIPRCVPTTVDRLTLTIHEFRRPQLAGLPRTRLRESEGERGQAEVAAFGVRNQSAGFARADPIGTGK